MLEESLTIGTDEDSQVTAIISHVVRPRREQGYKEWFHGIAADARKFKRRGDLTNDQWQRLHPLLPDQKPAVGRPSLDHRTVVNGILWILRTGTP